MPARRPDRGLCALWRRGKLRRGCCSCFSSSHWAQVSVSAADEKQAQGQQIQGKSADLLCVPPQKAPVLVRHKTAGAAGGEYRL